ncbi:hypothetical protein HPB50_027166 [Hyalomma asiaticum]|uniref:Uncharacterized protein n=1 Tax=Hyalomma asiaticum TaxID=266040 RepID=A0ACB7RWY1_HYAAI|nr:hypothetical protein HPB50_027166 [Hyalomma asiaticum]
MSHARHGSPQVATSPRLLRKPDGPGDEPDNQPSPVPSRSLLAIHKRSLSAKLGYIQRRPDDSNPITGASTIPPRGQRRPKRPATTVANVNASRDARSGHGNSERGSPAPGTAEVTPDAQSEFPGRQAPSQMQLLAKGKAEPLRVLARHRRDIQGEHDDDAGVTAEAERLPTTVATSSKSSSYGKRQYKHQQGRLEASSPTTRRVSTGVPRSQGADDALGISRGWQASPFSNAQEQMPQHSGTPSPPTPEAAERSRRTVAQLQASRSSTPQSLLVAEESNPSTTTSDRARAYRVTFLQTWTLCIVAVGTLAMPLGMLILSYIATRESDSVLPSGYPPIATPGSRITRSKTVSSHTLPAHPTPTTADPWAGQPVSCRQAPRIGDNVNFVNLVMSPRIRARSSHNFFCLYNNTRFHRGPGLDFLPTNLPFAFCKHVVYWSFGISDGVPISRTPHFDQMYGLGKLRATVNNSGNSSVGLVLAIGGYSSDQPQFSLLGRDDGALSRFVRGVMKIVRQHFLDGIAIHYKEPEPGCPSQADGDASALREIFSALRRIFQLNGFRGLLSVIVPTEASSKTAILDGVVDVVDYAFVDVRQLKPSLPISYSFCRMLALDLVALVQNSSSRYQGNEAKFCPVLSVAPWLVEALFGTLSHPVPTLVRPSTVSMYESEPGFSSMIAICRSSRPCRVRLATSPGNQDACLAVRGASTPQQPFVHMLHSEAAWREIFYRGLPAQLRSRCALLDDLDLDNYENHCPSALGHYWLMRYLYESLGGTGSRFAVSTMPDC